MRLQRLHRWLTQVGPGKRGHGEGRKRIDSHSAAQQSLPKSLLVYSDPPTPTSDRCRLNASPPVVVLDTNTVLDWLVFRDPAVQPLATAVKAGTLRWLVCARMREELARTLTYTSLEHWKPDSERTLACFDRYAIAVPPPPAAPLSLRCSDPDDQVFLDLALAHGAGWLATRDKALLRLARRSRPFGLLILKPGDWHPA